MVMNSRQPLTGDVVSTPQNHLRNNSLKSKSTLHEDSTMHNYLESINNVIMGRFQPYTIKSRPQSFISIQEMDYEMIDSTKRQLMARHPLNQELPNQWKNIPIPVRDAFKNLIKTILAGDESTFDYQMKTNERLLKLQNLIEQMQEDHTKLQYKFLQFSTNTDYKLQTMEVGKEDKVIKVEKKLQKMEMKVSDINHYTSGLFKQINSQKGEVEKDFNKMLSNISMIDKKNDRRVKDTE